MKKLGVLAFLLVTGSWSMAQSWTAMANLTGAGRYAAVGFSIGNKGYIGTGGNAGGILQDLWEWDQGTNTWTQKANIPVNPGKYNGIGFSIGTKGYIGTGSQGGGNFFTADFWEWDQGSNTWTQKTGLSGGGRNGATGFSIGNKGYAGLGYDGAYKKDFWEYNPSSNTWTQKADFGGTARVNPVGFSIGPKGYVGTGTDVSGKLNDFWEWDQGTNTWSAKANVGTVAKNSAVGFSIGNKGYIGTGLANGGFGVYTQDFWEWDQSTNTWTQKANFGGTGRWLAVGFAIGNCGYIGTGSDGTYANDFWEYCACTPSAVDAGANASINQGASTTLNSTGGFVSYNWSPATGLDCTTCQNPLASPTQTTTYYLVVTDNNGCTSKDSVTISLNECGTLFVPNAFSPNGDGSNDVLYVNSNCVKELSFIIYNRWGENVFSASDISSGWDGTCKGEKTNSGVFVYHLKAVMLSGETILQDGNIHLIR